MGTARLSPKKFTRLGQTRLTASRFLSLFLAIILLGSALQGSVAQQDVTVAESLVAPKLAAPTNGAVVQAVGITLAWYYPGATPVRAYQVQIATDPGFSAMVDRSDGVVGELYTPRAKLSAGVTYFWRVAGYSSAGELSPYSDVWSFTVAGAPQPTPENTPTPVPTTPPTMVPTPTPTEAPVEPTATPTQEPSVTAEPSLTTTAVVDEGLDANGAFIIVGGGQSTNAPSASVLYDHNMSSIWTTNTTTAPQTAFAMVDLGEVKSVGKVRWVFGVHGQADRYRLDVSSDGVSWKRLYYRSNFPVGRWVEDNVDGQARYVRWSFENPNNDVQVGGLAEVQVMPAGSTAPPPTLTPTASPTPSPTPTATATPAPDNSRISISPQTGKVGTKVTVTGSGFMSGETVGVHWNSTSSNPLTTATANASGSFTVTVTVPTAPAGNHLIAARGQKSGWKASRTFTVEAGTPTPTPGSGSTYYISPSGNDSADGRTPQTAWRTFANVSAPKVPDGATILAQAGGTWTETITVRRNDLKFGVYGSGARPKIIAPAGTLAFNGGSRVGTELVGYEFTGTTRQGGSYGLIFIGAVGDNPASRYVVRDIVAHGVDGYLLITRGGGGLIENSLFYDSNGSGGTVAVSVGGWEGDGPPPAGSTTVFRNNTVRDTGYRAVANWGGNVRIEGNTIARWTAAGKIGNATQAPAGIYVTSRFQGGVVVTGNTLTGTGVEYRGIWVDYGPNAGVVVEGNTVRAALHCVSVENTHNVIVRGNTCADIRDRGIQWVDGSLNGQITGNTFVGPEPPRDWIWIQSGASATQSNNTYLP